MRKTVSAMLIAVILIATSVPAFGGTACGEPEIVADVLLVRPLGVAAIVIGTAALIVSLPFSIPSGSVGTVARALVAEPAKYTFSRPIGDFSENWERQNLQCSER